MTSIIKDRESRVGSHPLHIVSYKGVAKNFLREGFSKFLYGTNFLKNPSKMKKFFHWEWDLSPNPPCLRAWVRNKWTTPSEKFKFPLVKQCQKLVKVKISSQERWNITDFSVRCGNSFLRTRSLTLFIHSYTTSFSSVRNLLSSMLFSSILFVKNLCTHFNIIMFSSLHHTHFKLNHPQMY